MTKAQTIKAKEIENGKALIACFSLPENSDKPGAAKIPMFQERISYLENLTDEQTEFAQHFLYGTVSGMYFDSLVSFINKNFK